MINIFVHGLGQTPVSWEKTLDNMEQSGKSYCPELCELVKNKETNYETLYSSFAEYCNKFEEPLNLCGLSLGAVLSLNYAIKNPTKVNSLILIAAQYKMPKYLLKFQNFIFRFMPTRAFEEIGFGKKDFIVLSETMMDIDFSNDLGNINCPVLLLCGAKDNANKRASLKLNDYLNNSLFKVIENASHEVNVDNPSELAKFICDFYDGNLF